MSFGARPGEYPDGSFSARPGANFNTGTSETMPRPMAVSGCMRASQTRRKKSNVTVGVVGIVTALVIVIAIVVIIFLVLQLGGTSTTCSGNSYVAG